MNYKIIATGSEGNALYIEQGAASMLIDCGVPFSKIKKLPFQMVFLTHKHSDHFNPVTISRIALEKPNTIFFCGPYMIHDLTERGVNEKNIFSIENGAASISTMLATTTARRVDLKHDVPNSGWKIRVMSEDGEVFIFYATDTENLDGIVAARYDYYFIEANYDEDEIVETIKDKREKGEYVYEERVLKTHMSKQDAEKWLADQAGENSTFVWMHEHTDAHEAKE